MTTDDPPRIPNPFEPSAACSGRPFVVRYELAARHRGVWLNVVALFSLIVGFCGVFLMEATWFLGNLPLSAAALVFALYVFFTAADDLRAIDSGARDPAGRLLTWFAQYFGLLIAIWILAMYCAILYCCL